MTMTYVSIYNVRVGALGQAKS